MRICNIFIVCGFFLSAATLSTADEPITYSKTQTFNSGENTIAANSPDYYTKGLTASSDGTILSILGGNFSGNITASGGALIFIKGGSFEASPASSLVLNGTNSVIEIFGSAFELNDSLTALGQLTKAEGDGNTLSGYLADGEAFSFDLNMNGNNPLVVLTAVPEPSTYAAIIGAVGLLFVMNKRRKRAIA